MADDGVTAGDASESKKSKSNENRDEVFENGELDDAKGNSYLHPEYGAVTEQVLPRRSSLLKDSSRRNQRKKTVSFSSMPNEKTVVNGK